MYFFDTLDLHHADHERLLRDRQAYPAAWDVGVRSDRHRWTRLRPVRRTGR